MTFTAEEKLSALRRELNYRRFVFPRRVAEGKMKQSEAEAQIAVFQAIEADYEAKAKEERLL